MKTYTLEDKPEFKNGDFVDINLDVLIGNGGVEKNCKIVGKAVIEVVDLWIVDFGKQFSDIYPFPCLCVPHICIVDKR